MPAIRGSTAQALAGGDLGYEPALLWGRFLACEVKGLDGADRCSVCLSVIHSTPTVQCPETSSCT